MADYDMLKQIKQSRQAKVDAVTGGDSSRFEWSRDRAARIAQAAFYSQPASMIPKDVHAPQALGDRAVNQQAPDYVDDVKGTEERWADGRLTASGPWGSDDGMAKPDNRGSNPGAGYSGVGAAAAHSPGRATARNLPKDPATTGRGARRR
jgi:hypothetical protein